MYLVLGEDDDWLCGSVRETLERRGQEVRIIPDIFGRSATIAWRIETERSSSRFVLEDGTVLSDEQISAVLVRRPRFSARQDWKAEDEVYIYAEKEAALLGWIWTLRCPVINRYPAELWFEPAPPPLFWSRQLAACGLQCAGSDLMQAGHSHAEGSGLGKSYSAAVVASHVVWDQKVAINDIETRLVQFAKTIGLACVKCEFTTAAGSPQLTVVETFPTFEEFSSISRAEIVERIADLMIGSSSSTDGNENLDRSLWS